MLISLYILIAATETPWEYWPPFFFLHFSVLFGLGVLAVVGGVFALIHNKWRLALAGAAAVIPLAFITVSVLAAVAEYEYNIPVPYTISLEVLLSISPIVLLLLSKREFK